MHLLDTRFNRIAKGVGTAKILDRIHNAQTRLTKDFVLGCYFVIVEEKGRSYFLDLI